MGANDSESRPRASRTREIQVRSLDPVPSIVFCRSPASFDVRMAAGLRRETLGFHAGLESMKLR